MAIDRHARYERLEDRPLLTGSGRFAADINFPGQLHMRVVRSPVAHGRILGIDDERGAGASPAWRRCGPSADVAAIPPIDFRQVRVAGPRSPTASRSWRSARCAMSASRWRWSSPPTPTSPKMPPSSSSPTSTTCRRCLDPTAAPGEFDEGIATEAGDRPQGLWRCRCCLRGSAARRRADARPSAGTAARRSKRAAPSPGSIPPSGILEIYGAAKVPHINRKALAKLLDLPLERIHLYEGHVGGGFGIRGEIYPEDVLVALAALRLGRPVKWIEDRREHLIAANHSRDQVHRIRAAVDANGFILAIDDEFWADQGAYVRTHAATVADLTCAMLPGPYRRSGLPRRRPHPPDQQDALRHLSRARTLRGDLRPRAAHRRDRRHGSARTRSRSAGINLIPREQMPFQRGLDALGTEVDLRLGRLCRPPRQAARASSDYDALRERDRRAAAGGRAGRLRPRLLRREERARPLRRRPRHARGDRRHRGGDRRRLARAGHRDRHRPDLRRRAWRAARRRSASSTARPTASATAWAPSPRAPP